ncbi:hypothetical protein [Enterovibrio norvegicus]|uniref:hypothetical protein n=1 Tax=Enterovibrio norvegicus TaxID=188144 RepID=UPI00352E1893
MKDLEEKVAIGTSIATALFFVYLIFPHLNSLTGLESGYIWTSPISAAQATNLVLFIVILGFIVNVIASMQRDERGGVDWSLVLKVALFGVLATFATAIVMVIAFSVSASALMSVGAASSTALIGCVVVALIAAKMCSSRQ